MKITDLPTDRYGRYSSLAKELVKAVGTAERSEDNLEMLIKYLDVVAEGLGYNVVKKPSKRTAKKDTE